jgi:hypothetical protein
MHPLYLLAQGRGSGNNGPNYIRLIGFLIIVGFSVLSWVLRKVQEQAAKKKAQEAIERRELELLRTGRPESGVMTARVATTSAPPAPAGPPAQSEVDRRIEELRRRREAMARRRAEEGSRTVTQTSASAPPTAPSPRPAPPPDRPTVFVPGGSEGPIFVPRQRTDASTSARPATPAPRPAVARAKRDQRPEEPKRPAKPASRNGGRGHLADTLERRDASQAARNAETAPAPPPLVIRSSDAIPRSPAEWRRALIAREVLAPPLGLRTVDDIPPGLLS